MSSQIHVKYQESTFKIINALCFYCLSELLQFLTMIFGIDRCSLYQGIFFKRTTPEVFIFTTGHETTDIPHIFPTTITFIRCIVMKLNIEHIMQSLPPLIFLLFTRGEVIFFFIFAILVSAVCGTESCSEPLGKIKSLITH